jgi:hypothetical protein
LRVLPLYGQSARHLVGPLASAFIKPPHSGVCRTRRPVLPYLGARPRRAPGAMAQQLPLGPNALPPSPSGLATGPGHPHGRGLQSGLPLVSSAHDRCLAHQGEVVLALHAPPLRTHALAATAHGAPRRSARHSRRSCLPLRPRGGSCLAAAAAAAAGAGGGGGGWPRKGSRVKRMDLGSQLGVGPSMHVVSSRCCQCASAIELQVPAAPTYTLVCHSPSRITGGVCQCDRR